MTKRVHKKKSNASSSTERVRAYRARMRAKGMREIRFWVPDVRTPEFAAEARRQCLLLAKSPYERDDQAFIDANIDQVARALSRR